MVESELSRTIPLPFTSTAKYRTSLVTQKYSFAFIFKLMAQFIELVGFLLMEQGFRYSDVDRWIVKMLW